MSRAKVGNEQRRKGSNPSWCLFAASDLYRPKAGQQWNVISYDMDWLKHPRHSIFLSWGVF